MSLRRLWTPALLFAAALYVTLRLATGAAVVLIETPFDGNLGVSTDVTIARGQSAAQIAATLQEAGVVRNARVLRWWMRYTGQAARIHTGEYRFRGPASVREVAAIITEGRVLLLSVTVLEGATRWHVAEALAAAGFGSYPEAWEATAAASLIADIDPDAPDLEGYLFPDTYFAPRSSSPRELVGMMVSRFRQAWTSVRRARAAELGLSTREAVTVASLVEAETGLAAERALVAGVYHNRLARKMLLQCDPTLLYALRLEGRTDRNIRRSDFVNESPYNTYRVAGLPPGPIGSPGEASLEAALWPAETDFLYFVGRNDGSHAFSRTLAEHNANVNRYQR